MAGQGRNEVRNLVTAQLAQHLNKPEHGIREDSDLVDDLGADSLDIVELTLIFEEQFHVEIPDDDVERMQTVGDIVNYLFEKGNYSMVEENEVTPVDEAIEQTPPEDPEDEVNEPEGDDPEDDPEED